MLLISTHNVRAKHFLNASPLRKPHRVSQRLLLIICFALLAIICRAQISTPKDFLGYNPGADYHLASYEDLVGYFKLVESQSSRIKLFSMGLTSEGRDMKYAIISSADNMDKLDEYREIAKKLSLGKNLNKEEAKQLAKKGKVIVWIDSGIHASETSGPMHQFHLAYDLITAEDEETLKILDSVILLLVEANPDGMTIVANWYNNNVGTKFEKSRLPVLYHKYAGHDTNRDAFMANLVETQNMNKILGCEWYPEIVYCQHESAPFPARIWMPPNPEPVNPNLHPIITRWKNLIGSAMGQGFEAADQPGAISRNAFDLWYPGYLDGPAVEAHNIPSILTETANAGLATPKYYTIRDFPEAYRDLTPGTFYPSPWEGGWWHLSDAIEYNLTASKSILDMASKYSYELLYYKYKMATDIITKYKNEPPYGWIVSAEQKDKHSTILMINRLIGYGVEVYKSEKSFEQNGIAYPEGSYIFPTSQPFGLYLKNLFEKQNYPDLRKYPHLWQGIASPKKWEGPPLAPYDGVGWTMPIQMGVEYHEMSKPITVERSLINEAFLPDGNISGNGKHYIFTDTDNSSYIAANKILKAGGKLGRALKEFSIKEEIYPPGTFILTSNSLNKNTLTNIANETNVSLVSGNTSVNIKSLVKNKIALYKSWSASMDAGWISMILERYEFNFHFLTDAEVRTGNLKKHYDVIILPDQGASSILNGNSKGSIHPDYVGGITSNGMENLKEFVKLGGILLCNENSCNLAISEFKLPVQNALAKIKSDKFNCPGSIVKVKYDTDNPLAFGFSENGTGFFARSLVFEMKKDSVISKSKNKTITKREKPPEVNIIASYPDDPLLVSGWMIGDELIRRKAAIIDVPIEKGRIILYGFNFHNRAQSYQTFKLLFNALLY